VFLFLIGDFCDMVKIKMKVGKHKSFVFPVWVTTRQSLLPGFDLFDSSVSLAFNCLSCLSRECGHILISKGNTYCFNVITHETAQEIFLTKEIQACAQNLCGQVDGWKHTSSGLRPVSEFLLRSASASLSLTGMMGSPDICVGTNV
jgi:hypothetical protein